MIRTSSVWEIEVSVRREIRKKLGKSLVDLVQKTQCSLQLVACDGPGIDDLTKVVSVR